jgi:hypothetical protein
MPAAKTRLQRSWHALEMKDRHCKFVMSLSRGLYQSLHAIPLDAEFSNSSNRKAMGKGGRLDGFIAASFRIYQPFSPFGQDLANVILYSAVHGVPFSCRHITRGGC